MNFVCLRVHESSAAMWCTVLLMWIWSCEKMWFSPLLLLLILLFSCVSVWLSSLYTCAFRLISTFHFIRIASYRSLASIANRRSIFCSPQHNYRRLTLFFKSKQQREFQIITKSRLLLRRHAKKKQNAAGEFEKELNIPVWCSVVIFSFLQIGQQKWGSF